MADLLQFFANLEHIEMVFQSKNRILICFILSAVVSLVLSIELIYKPFSSRQKAIEIENIKQIERLKYCMEHRELHAPCYEALTNDNFKRKQSLEQFSKMSLVLSKILGAQRGFSVKNISRRFTVNKTFYTYVLLSQFENDSNAQEVFYLEHINDNISQMMGYKIESNALLQ